MSEEFDPAWEYYAGDPEVEDFLAAESRQPRTSEDLAADRHTHGRRSGLRGWLFYRPGDKPMTRLGRDMPIRERESKCRRLDCRWCGASFVEHRPMTGRYCSVACAASGRAAARRARPESLACEQCGESFEPAKVGQTLCSLTCFGAKIRRPTFERGCPTCGGEIPPQAVRRGMPKKYCSRACMHTMVKRRYSRKK